MISKWALHFIFGITAVLVAVACSAETASEPEVVQTRGFGGVVGAVGEQTLADAVGYASELARLDFRIKCIRSAGFPEYQESLENAPPPRSGRPGDPNRDLSDEQYAEEFGFGIAESSFGELVLPLPQDDGGPPWIEALSGPARLALTDTVNTCDRESIESLDEEYGLFVAPLLAAETEVAERLRVDSRVLEAEAVWSACMAEGGFPNWVHPGELTFSLAAELAEVDSSSEDEVEQFRDREIRLALASQACRVDFDPVVTNVRLEIEDDLLETREDLAQIADQIAN